MFVFNFALIQGYLNPTLNNPAHLLLGQIFTFPPTSQIFSEKPLMTFLNSYYFIFGIIFQSVHNA